MFWGPRMELGHITDFLHLLIRTIYKIPIQSSNCISVMFLTFKSSNVIHVWFDIRLSQYMDYREPLEEKPQCPSGDLGFVFSRATCSW